MAELTAVLDGARTAYRRGDWEAARSGFEAARDGALTTGTDLRDLAACHWWLGDQRASLDELEAAFRAHQDAGADVAAAEVALVSALIRLTRGDLTVGTAWARRAGRMIADVPDAPAHAYLTFLVTSMDLEGTGELWAMPSVIRMRELDARLRSPAVSALTAVVEGMHAIRAGRTAEGFAFLDEAMLCVISGRLEAEWAGDVLCTTIHVCHELADFRRMADWTRATEEWCASLGADLFFAGVCRVHRLELQSAAGEWDAAEAALQRACDDLVSENPWVAGEGWYQLGEIRRLRGDGSGARAAYGRARESGIDPAPGEALLELSDGHPDRARALIAASLGERDRMARARLLRAGIEIALSLKLPDEARTMLAELESAAVDYASDGFLAWADHARGMVSLDAGEPRAAMLALRRALDRFRRLSQPWEQAQVMCWLAGAHEAVHEDAAADRLRSDAQAIFTRLGALPLPVPTTPRATDAGPLTPREREIVQLAAAGRSNRQIAGELYISEKTVGRHLANVYVKLGVGSRTAAAAWWHEHQHGRRIR